MSNPTPPGYSDPRFRVSNIRPFGSKVDPETTPVVDTKGSKMETRLRVRESYEGW